MKRLTLAFLVASCASDPAPGATPLSAAELRARPAECDTSRERMAKSLMDYKLRGDTSNYYDAAQTYVACTLPAYSATRCPALAEHAKRAEEARDGAAFVAAIELYVACTRAPDDMERAAPAASPRGL